MVGIIYPSDCDRVNLFEYLGKSAVLAVLPLITPLHYTEKITLLNSEHVNKSTQTVTRAVWQYGLWRIQTGDTKLKRFLPKNQHTLRKLFNFEFWINGELSKSAKI